MFQIVLTTFSPRELWTSNPFHRFVDNLNTAIKEKMETNNFKRHLQPVQSEAHVQIDLIQQAFEAATEAESELARQKKPILKQLKKVHKFIGTVHPANSEVAKNLYTTEENTDDVCPNCSALSCLLSACEATMQKYCNSNIMK